MADRSVPEPEFDPELEPVHVSSALDDLFESWGR